MIEDSSYYKTVNDAYPNIGKKIRVFWGYPEFVALMRELQTNDGERPKAGFPADVLLALHELATDHDHFYPQFAHRDRSIWDLG
jgi:hypothetical protein